MTLFRKGPAAPAPAGKALGGPFAGLGLEAFAPMILLGIKKANLEEMAAECVAMLEPHLTKSDDRRRVAVLLGLISAGLSPALSLEKGDT